MRRAQTRSLIWAGLSDPAPRQFAALAAAREHNVKLHSKQRPGCNEKHGQMGGGIEGRRRAERLEELGKKKTNTVEYLRSSKRLRESPKMKWWVWVRWVCVDVWMCG